MLTAIFNHNPLDLKIKEELEESGISAEDFSSYQPKGDHRIDLLIIHCRPESENVEEVTQKRFFDVGKEGWLTPETKLKPNGIVLFVSSVGLNETIQPAKLPFNKIKGDFFAFGLNNPPCQQC